MPKSAAAKPGFIASAAIKLLALVIPKGNPDFEGNIDKVKTWWVEIDRERDFANREIGFDETGALVMVLPYKNNEGYWTDNNLKLADFKRLFDVIEIEGIDFEKRWNEFEQKNGADE